MHYVVGDVHGCLDEMLGLIGKIEAQDPEARFIFVGDFVDRGPKVMETLRWAMENITAEGKYQSVLGNHEDMLIDWYETHFIKWYNHPRRFLLKQPMPATYYDFSARLQEEGLTTPEQVRPFIDFFRSLPLTKKIRVGSVHYVIAHAWYDFSLSEDCLEQRETNLWSREYSGLKRKGTMIVHGHTPTLSVEYCSETVRPGMIDFEACSINVDGGATFFYLGRACDRPRLLCAVCLENLEEFYSETVEENFARMAAWEEITEETAESYRGLYEQKYLKPYDGANKQKLLAMLGMEKTDEEEAE